MCAAFTGFGVRNRMVEGDAGLLGAAEPLGDHSPVPEAAILVLAPIVSRKASQSRQAFRFPFPPR